MQIIFFDIIISSEIIEHIYDTDFFLQEIFRILKPDGKLLITTPNVASFGRRIMLFLGLNPLIETSVDQGNSGHIRYFTFKSLKRLLNKNGFKIIKKHSDVINFNNFGTLKTHSLPKYLFNFGQSIIYLTQKNENRKKY
ncbi:methyltransferase domain-containing protein [Patescibacteria group bacterium]